MSTESVSPVNSQSYVNDPYFELNENKNQWLVKANSLSPNRFQSVQNQINATAKKIEDLCAKMKLRGASPEEIQLEVKKQLPIFNTTCQSLVQNQSQYQNSKESLRNALNQPEVKANRTSPLSLDKKEPTPAKEKLQKDELWEKNKACQSHLNKAIEELKECPSGRRLWNQVNNRAPFSVTCNVEAKGTFEASSMQRRIEIHENYSNIKEHLIWGLSSFAEDQAANDLEKTGGFEALSKEEKETFYEKFGFIRNAPKIVDACKEYENCKSNYDLSVLPF